MRARGRPGSRRRRRHQREHGLGSYRRACADRRRRVQEHGGCQPQHRYEHGGALDLLWRGAAAAGVHGHAGRLGGRAARLRRSVLRLRGGADADDARYHQDARDVLGSGYDPGPGQLRCLGKQSAFGRAAHLRAGRHRDQPNRAGGAEALVGQVRLGHDGRQDGSDDSFVRLPPGRHSVLPAVRLIGTKGSDPSVYVLLYMLG